MNPVRQHSTGRQAEIDSVRGLAVLLVVFDHLGLSQLWGGFPWGIFGVKLLFVFSGYFLAREAVKAATGEGIQLDLERYYLKRIARLVPLCYAAIFGVMLLGLDGAGPGWGWHLFFLTNFRIMWTGEWAGCLSHLWSLSMQMQFYLLWPLLLLWWPPRRWGAGLLGVGLLAWAYRFFCLATDMPEMLRWLHLPWSLDAFAAGTAVAWVEKFRPTWRERFRRSAGWFMGLAMVAIVTACRLRAGGFPAWLQAMLESFECLFVVIVMLSLRWEANPMACILRIWPLPLLGTISFSLYAFHPLVENVWHTRVLPVLPLLAVNPWLAKPLLLALTLLVAVVVWRCIEKPVPGLLLNAGERLLAGVRPTVARWLQVRSAAWSCAVAICALVFVCGPGFYSQALRRDGPAFISEFDVVPDEIGPKNTCWSDDAESDENFLFPPVIDDGRREVEGHV